MFGATLAGEACAGSPDFFFVGGLPGFVSVLVLMTDFRSSIHLATVDSRHATARAPSATFPGNFPAFSKA
jgi:hypothetical protein